MLLLTLMIFNNSVVYADGNSLIRSCSSAVKLLNGLPGIEEEHVGMAFCVGFVRGVSETMVINGNSLSPSKIQRIGICNPDKRSYPIPSDQGVRVVLKYLENHPEKLGEDDIVLVIRALQKAFPCP